MRIYAGHCTQRGVGKEESPKSIAAGISGVTAITQLAHHALIAGQPAFTSGDFQRKVGAHASTSDFFVLTSCSKEG